MLYQGSEGSWTPGKPVSLWRKVNFLAIYTKSNHDPNAVVGNADWLDLNTFPPVEDALLRTKSLLNTWKKWLYSDGNSMFWPCYWITPWIHTSEPTAVAYVSDWLLQNTSPPMEPVRTALIQYKWPEQWLALMAKPVFQVLRSLMHLGRSSIMGENVSRWSPSALFTIAVGSENLYVWFNSVSMARILTCLYGTTGFPGVDVPSGPW